MDQLKRKRSIIKGKFTTILTYCDNSNANEEGIRSRCEKLDEYFKEFENIQDDIEVELNDEELEIELSYRAEMEDLYFNLKGRSYQCESINRGEQTVVENIQINQKRQAIDTLVHNQSVLGTIVDHISNNTSTPDNNLTNTVNQHNSIQLPRTQLPIFNGNFNEWLRFRDLFQTLIHNKTNISNIEKFEYLQGHLRGEALSVIKHLTSSNDNYEIGWNLIKNKFDNLDALKKNYLRLLFDQATMKGAFTSELKRLLNNSNEGTNALQALGEPVDNWNSILIFHLERKLDPESQTLWCR